MAQENLSSKILPSSNIEPTVHPLYPANKVTYLDQSVERVVPTRIYPESTDISNGAPIEFVIHECSEHYIDLSSIKLEVGLKILDAAGGRDAATLAAGRIYFTNNLLSALFPVVKVFINNTSVESQYHAHHIANLNHIREIPNALASNRGRCSGVFGLYKEGVGAETTNAIADFNAERKTFSKKDLVFLKGYLNIDVASSNKWLVDGTTVRIVLDQAKAEQIINATVNLVDWRYEITSIRLLVNRIQPTRAAFLNTSRYLQNHSMEYIFKQNVVHTQIVDAGHTSLTINRPFNSKIPSLFHIFFVSQAAEQGSFKNDRFYYNTNDLGSYRVTINGRVLMDDEVMAGSEHMSIYEDSREACHASDKFIPTKLYTHGSFVVSVRTNNSQPGELMYETSGNLVVFINFTQALAATQLCFVVGEFHSSYEITPERQCLTNSSY